MNSAQNLNIIHFILFCFSFSNVGHVDVICGGLSAPPPRRKTDPVFVVHRTALLEMSSVRRGRLDFSLYQREDIRIAPQPDN